jgi:hypothetical protein
VDLADKVSIDIPGVGLVEALNAAQESTLRDILAAIEKSGSGGGGGGSTAADDKANTKSKKENTDETDENTDRMKKWGQTTAQAVKSVGTATKGVVTAFTGSDGAAGAIKGAGEAIKGALSGIPVVGAALGAGFGFLTAQVAQTMENFESAQASGASFGNSMMVLRDVSAQAGITMGQMAAVAKQAGESLSMFGGGTAQGARDFAKFNGAVRNSGMDKQMVRMGMSFQDQAIAMADYTGQLATFGENVSTLDTADVAKNFFELTKQQKMLSQYNGITLEQQRQEMKAKQKDVNLRALTMGMDAKQQEAAGALASQLTKLGGPVAEQYMKEMLAHGGAVSAETALFAQSFPELAKMANEGAAGLKAGTLETADTMRMMGQLDPAAMKAQAMAAGEQLRMTIGTGVSNPLTEVIGKTLVPALDTQAKAINQTAAKIQADNAELAKGTDQLTESYVGATEAVQDFKVGMEAIATSVMESGAFNESLKFMTDMMTKAAKTIGDIGEASKGENVAGNMRKVLTPDHDASEGLLTDMESTMAGAATGAAVGMIAGPIGAAIGSLIGAGFGYFAGKEDNPEGKAAGGPVNAGSKYQVNEIGQELFTPSTQGTISPHSAYKNIMSDMSGMKAQMSRLKEGTEASSGSITPGAAMAGATESSSNPFSEDQEVRNALISLPSIMMENMNHLQTVNNTLEVKLTELSRNVA